MSLIETLIRDTPGIGEEVCIPVAGSKTIRATAGKEGDQTVLVDLVRVIDEHDGSELLRFTETQIASEPAKTIAAIVDACSMTVMFDHEYRNERVIAVDTGTGRTLRTDLAEEPLTPGGAYVRILEADGTEVGYWVCDEIAEDPQSAFAAVLASFGGDIVIRRGRS